MPIWMLCVFGYVLCGMVCAGHCAYTYEKAAEESDGKIEPPGLGMLVFCGIVWPLYVAIVASEPS